jgi:hypothetical protein
VWVFLKIAIKINKSRSCRNKKTDAGLGACTGLQSINLKKSLLTNKNY